MDSLRPDPLGCYGYHRATGSPFENDPPHDWIMQDYLNQSQDACGMPCAKDALGGGWGSCADVESYKDYPHC